MTQFLKEMKQAFEERGLMIGDLDDDEIGGLFECESGEPLYFKLIDHEDNTCSMMFFKNIDINDYERIDLLEAINKLNRETCVMGTVVCLFEKEGCEPDVRVVSSETFVYGETKRILEAYDNALSVAAEIDRIF